MITKIPVSVPSNVPIEVRDYYREVIATNEIMAPLYCEETDLLNGVINLMFTTAIIHDVTLNGYGQRFCFQDPRLAMTQHVEWHHNYFDSLSLPRGWVACRGVSRNQLNKSFGPHYGENVLQTAENLIGGPVRLHSQLLKLEKEIAIAVNCTVNHVRHISAYFSELGIIK